MSNFGHKPLSIQAFKTAGYDIWDRYKQYVKRNSEDITTERF